MRTAYLATVLVLPAIPASSQPVLPEGSHARLEFSRHLASIEVTCSPPGNPETHFRPERSFNSPDLALSVRLGTFADCGFARIDFNDINLTVVRDNLTADLYQPASMTLPKPLLVSSSAKVALSFPNLINETASASIFNSSSAGSQFCGQTQNNQKQLINGPELLLRLDSCAEVSRQDLSNTVLFGTDYRASIGGASSDASWPVGPDRKPLLASIGIHIVVLTEFQVIGSGGAPPNPFPQPKPTDHSFVGSIDTPWLCQMKAAGPVRVPVSINRVVGQSLSGVLVRPNDLILNGVLSGVARLRIPMFQRDLGDGKETTRHRVKVNGQDDSLAAVSAVSDSWQVLEVRIPVQALRFPNRLPGRPPDGFLNEIAIEIDVDGTGDAPRACLAVDWVEVSFDALYPVILVHGNGQGDDNNGGSFWDGLVLGDPKAPRLQLASYFTQELKERFVLYDNSISMPSGPTSGHGSDLAAAIPRIASEFGARHVHIVAHSKGGLDSRDFLGGKAPANFGVLSLTTISTPHHGSSGPDYQLDAVEASIVNSESFVRSAIAWFSPPNGGTEFLRTAAVGKFNVTNRPLLPSSFTVDGEENPIVYQSVSADMDLANPAGVTHSISFDETTGLPGQGYWPDRVWAGIIDQVYDIIGEVASTRVEVVQKRLIGPGGVSSEVPVSVIRETKTASFQDNDVAVSCESARFSPPFTEIASVKANHSTVCSKEVARIVVDSLLKIQDVNKPRE